MIRTATKKDIPQIFNLMFIIWQDMNYPLLNLLSIEKFKHLMCYLMTHNSFKFYFGNCLVFEENHIIKGILYAYNGHHEQYYNNFLTQYIRVNQPQINIKYLNYGLESFNDEIYIDALIVHTNYRNKKIGTKLLTHFINNTPTKIGLNCEIENISAKKLYEHLDFKYQQTITFLGHDYLHLVKEK